MNPTSEPKLTPDASALLGGGLASNVFAGLIRVRPADGAIVDLAVKILAPTPSNGGSRPSGAQA